MDALTLVLVILILPLFLFLMRTWLDRNVYHAKRDNLMKFSSPAQVVCDADERIKQLEDENLRLKQEIEKLKARIGIE